MWNDDLIFNDDIDNHDDDDDDDDDDNDNTPVKQDYDLDNLYSREQPPIEEENDAISEDDDDNDDQMIFNDTSETSCTSNTRTQLQVIYITFCVCFISHFIFVW